MLHDTRIHVVIPAYNVAAHIRDVLKGLPDFVDVVTVVDDASADDTAEVARGVADPRVTVIRHAVNRGVGGAVVTGFREALRHADGIVVKMDGDGQMDPAFLARLLQPILDGRCDYAKGNRFLLGLAAMPRVRLIGNFALTFVTKLASGYWHIFDPQNGYVAVHTAALRLLDLDRLARRYFFENDMLIHLNIFNVRVMDVPMPARYGAERSSLRVSRVMLSFPFHFVRGYWYRFYCKHVLRDFTPVAMFMLTGLPLLAFGTLFGVYQWVVSSLHDRFASTGTVMLSVLPVIVGFELILQALVLEIRQTPRYWDRREDRAPGELSQGTTS
jgi:dolichol-phosphate mannosyltransferase